MDLGKSVTLAREMAILGDYDSALVEFKIIFQIVNEHAKKYDGSNKKNNMGDDFYLQEKWLQFKKDLKNEYDLIVQMHETLLQLEDREPDESLYEIEGFEQ